MCLPQYFPKNSKDAEIKGPSCIWKLNVQECKLFFLVTGSLFLNHISHVGLLTSRLRNKPILETFYT